MYVRHKMSHCDAQVSIYGIYVCICSLPTCIHYSMADDLLYVLMTVFGMLPISYTNFTTILR